MKTFIESIFMSRRQLRHLCFAICIFMLFYHNSFGQNKAGVAPGDISGTWVGAMKLPIMGDQTFEVVFELKSENGKITGSQKLPFGTDAQIVDGKINGSRLELTIRMESFGAFQDQMTTGEILDNELRIIPVMPAPPAEENTENDSATAGDEKSQGRQGNPPAGGIQTGQVVLHRGTPAPSYRAGRVDYQSLTKVTLPAAADLSSNGLAKTPPMGWNSWNKFQTRIDDKTVREIADAMVASGMKDAGYTYIVIDDGWQWKRNDNDVLMPNPNFPDMKALAEYVHSKGLKLGIYSSPGPRTCGGYEGSYGYEETDASTWAKWGIDYLKYDWCSASSIWSENEMRVVYQKMAEALRKAGRPIVYSLCQYGLAGVQQWGPLAGGNLWRTTTDISDRYQSMASNGFSQSDLAAYAGPEKWNDPDMLEIGNGGMSANEYKTHFSLWAMIASPLIAGNDLRDMTDETKEILTNREVIAIDQDPLGKGGYRLAKNGDTEVWIKPLANGDTAAALFNRGGSEAQISVKWSDLHLSGAPKVRDLWTHQDLGAKVDGFSATVSPHGVVMVRVSK
jgi:alpha-galactosidase